MALILGDFGEGGEGVVCFLVGQIVVTYVVEGYKLW